MHRCARCGGSCQGMRVRITPGERAQLLKDAATLGVEHPLSGPWLRQNWGVCVFYDAGCRLHAAFGADRKPAVCRRYPVIDGTVDPSCFHWTGSNTTEVDWEDLSVGWEVRERLRALPLVAVLDSPHLGPMATAQLEGLDRAEPGEPAPDDATALEARIGAALALAHGTEPALLVGGAQLIVGASKPIGAAFAAWMRLLRTGVL